MAPWEAIPILVTWQLPDFSQVEGADTDSFMVVGAL